MSGGFFRGTSADQDTRFSNKQAKLMKSQKFAAELDHLVDMAKVKMDVIRPWIANRVTELLGFEDEVLINFIYGLLDGKEVNGKEVQISLTGFMEKNTGKFMKELWILLLSAQKNASGVPQQFLDAKEEETRKKKVEADRIANEIQKKKEKESRELDQERLKKMDGAVEMKAAAADALDANAKTTLAKDSSIWSEDGKGPGERNGVRGRSRVPKSPQSAGHSPSPHRGSPSRSFSKSHSNSRSYSDSGRRKSRSVSRSPEARRRSISADRVHHSLRRRSITPRRRHSPPLSRSPRRRSSYLRRRSRSRSLRRSPSPLRRRRNSPSPMLRRSPSLARHRRSPSPVVRHRRSPSPVRRHRSPSPVRRRRSPSPIRRRGSPSPVRRRRSPSPVWHRRSPSPVRRRRSPSPVRRRRSPSPIRRRRSPSPIRRRRSPLPIRHRRSPSPMERESLSPVRRGLSLVHHRTPSLVRCRSPSPVHHTSLSPVQQRYQRSPLTPQRQSTSLMQKSSLVPARMRPHTPSHHRSPSPYESSSPSPTRHRDLSPVKRKSPSEYKRSPVQSPREKFRTRESLSPAVHRHSSSLRSPLRDLKDQNDLRKRSAISPSPERSPAVSESPLHAPRKRRTSEDRRSFSPCDSPVRQARFARIDDSNLSPPQKPRDKLRQGGPDTSKERKGANQTRDHKSVSSHRSMQKEDYSPDTVAPDCHPPESGSQPDKMDLKKKNQDLRSEKSSGRSAHPVTVDQEKSPILPAERRQSSYPGESRRSDERNHSRSRNGKDSDQRHKSENVTMVIEKVDHGNRSDTVDSGSEESYKHRNDNKEKRKHKYERKEVASDDDYSYDSETERKQAKRRRKEEKKLRKEEKRRRRDEKRRRKEERRAEKLKLKNHNDADGSDGEHVPKRVSHPSEDEATESEQKRLEIELRNKALESIKAKKISSR